MFLTPALYGILRRFEKTGKEVKIQYTDDSKPIYEAMGNKYQVIYDRLFDRRFDNSKFLRAVGEYNFEMPEIGLERCLREFLMKPKFRDISRSWKSNALMDKISHERTPLRAFYGWKSKIKYAVARYTPYFDLIMKG